MAYNKSKPTSFSSDQPIPDAAHDTFHRTAFAHALANQLAAAPSEEGFVVGLLRPWGTGKSSVLNIVHEYLRERSVSEYMGYHLDLLPASSRPRRNRTSFEGSRSGDGTSSSTRGRGSLLDGRAYRLIG